MALDQLLSRTVTTATNCMEWQGARTKDGYGKAYYQGKTTRVHRLVYSLAVGASPDGYVIDHLCFTRNCINPAHLRAVDVVTNCSRQRPFRKTHCKHGHEYTPDNTYVMASKTKRGTRRTCRQCSLKSSARYYLEHRK